MSTILAIKKELTKLDTIDRVMVRKDNSAPGLEQKGIMSFHVYFETSMDYKILKGIIESHGLSITHMLIIGGSYGYRFGFTVPKYQV